MQTLISHPTWQSSESLDLTEPIQQFIQSLSTNVKQRFNHIKTKLTVFCNDCPSDIAIIGYFPPDLVVSTSWPIWLCIFSCGQFENAQWRKVIIHPHRLLSLVCFCHRLSPDMIFVKSFTQAYIPTFRNLPEEKA